MLTQISIYRSKLYVLLLLLILTFGNNLFSQSLENRKNTLFFEWGNTIYGNTISIGYNYLFSDHIYGGVSLGRGYFQYDIPDNGNNIFVDNPPGINNTFSLTFNDIIDLRIGYVIKQHEGMRFFNKFESGISYTHFKFDDVYTDKNYPRSELWRGTKDYSLYSLLCIVNILDFVPAYINKLYFDFGFKARFTITENQKLVYENPVYGTIERTYNNNNGSSILWIYPELYLHICYSL